MEQILKIAGFIVDSFIHIWPYLLITIPLAVIIKLSGAAKFINIALSKKPMVSILLATIVGAFSPFCSCGVIPVITSLLVGGVPLAPVMSFWIASPSMDPEIFFLSTATIGLKLSVWRLAATFVISLFSGYITHLALQSGLLGKEILRENQVLTSKKKLKLSDRVVRVKQVLGLKKAASTGAVQFVPVFSTVQNSSISCCIAAEELVPTKKTKAETTQNNCSCSKAETPDISFHRKLLNETWKASFMVARFMALAFFINALIQFYVPSDFITNLLGSNGTFSVLIAALVGIPVYTSNITALPFVGGLLSLGMNQGAALAFLIAGPTTTLPAMMAVWGIVRRRVFFLYVSFSLIGAIVFGFLYNLFV